MGVSLFLQTMICPTISNYLQKKPDSVLSTSSGNELLAARRIFKVFEELYKPTSDLRTKEFEILKKIKECIQDIDRYIEVRRVEVDSEREEEKIQSLREYLQPYINLKLTSFR